MSGLSEKHTNQQEINRQRVLLYIAGLIFCAFGIVITKKCQWGISPDSSLPYVLELITGWSLGTWTMLFQFANAFLQMIVLKKIKSLAIWLQFVYAILYGRLIDLVHMLVPSVPDQIAFHILYLLIGVVCTAVGLYLLTQMNIVADSLISFVKAVSQITNTSLGKVKNIYDITLVIIAVVVSLIFTHQLQAIGVATLVSAICVGRLMHWCKGHVPVKGYEPIFV